MVKRKPVEPEPKPQKEVVRPPQYNQFKGLTEKYAELVREYREVSLGIKERQLVLERLKDKIVTFNLKTGVNSAMVGTLLATYFETAGRASYPVAALLEAGVKPEQLEAAKRVGKPSQVLKVTDTSKPDEDGGE